MLEAGDIVSIDCGAIIEGWHADAAITVPVGEVDAESQRLMDVDPGRRSRPRSPRRSTATGSATSAPRSRRSVNAAGFGVVREYVGHGIGTAMHEEPDVPNYGPGGPGPEAAGRAWSSRSSRWSPRAGPTTRTLDDGWTVVTADGSRAAHFEHTVAITDNGPEVLTLGRR